MSISVMNKNEDSKGNFKSISASNKKEDYKDNHISFPEDYCGYSPLQFLIPQHYRKYLEAILIPQGFVYDRVEKLAKDIVESIGDREVVALCVLKGSFKFFDVLLDKIKLYQSYLDEKTYPFISEYIRLKSYENEKSTGTIKIIGHEILDSLRDKNVLIVEDMIDTGATMAKLVSLIEDYNPRSINVVSLFCKKCKNPAFEPQFIGFNIPDKFVVGFGLDYNEYFRDLNHVAVLNKTGIEKFDQKNLNTLVL